MNDYFLLYLNNCTIVKFANLQQTMLQLKEFDKLFQILNTKERSLEQIEGEFLVTYDESLPVFKASNTLSHLLNHNLLTHQQRIIALFLLIENYKSEGIKKNPFGATILNISQITNQGFQRKMISDLIVEGKRQQYASIKIEQLFDDEQLMIELTDQRPQIKKMREDFVSQLPQISQGRKIELLNALPQASQRNKKVYPPQEFSPSAVKEKNLANGGVNIGILRPIPKFIEISGFQLDWLAPGVVADVHWDNTVDVDKKLAKCKGLIKRGLQSKLSKQQSTEIDRCLQNQAYAVLNLDLTPQNLVLLINNNPYVAVSFLIKLGNYTIIGDYLQSLLDCNISLNCIDVVVRLIKVIKLPAQFIEAFALKNLKQSQSIPENHKDRGKMARVISKFIVALIKAEAADFTQFIQEIKAFLHHFKDLQEIQLLDNLLNHNNHENEQE